MKKLLVFVLVLCCLLCACRQAPDVSGDQTSAAETTAPTEQAETTPETEPVTETTEGAAMVMPLPGTIDLNQLDQRTVAISLEEGDAYVDDTGVMQMQVTVYDYYFTPDNTTIVIENGLIIAMNRIYTP